VDLAWIDDKVVFVRDPINIDDIELEVFEPHCSPHASAPSAQELAPVSIARSPRVPDASTTACATTCGFGCRR
jgi:hypothetical protein